ncbi:FkbM family methyltransferase [Pseudomonas sp. ABC1]|uniref:FkbM family methyltransferase n=1 Tax=Pseudomonas sp. ABC1 TaxID=2748080 RepID=UPI0015C3F9F3|nr:FkbM family methyltransferase [Pseudomonas sp. ABC1]QLF94158.1 FkbM family methyltransferase [Pseudomonas sp. ABC1]
MNMAIDDYDPEPLRRRAIQFHELLCAKGTAKSYIFGRNLYANAVLKRFSIDGIIDDYTQETSYHGIPVVRSDSLEAGDIVLVASGGKPFTARAIVEKSGAIQLDYFAFQKHAAPDLPELVFNEGYEKELYTNRKRFEAIYEKLEDEESKDLFERLVNFRLTQDLQFLEGLRDKQDQQYFEDFLALKQAGETFLDVGSFDGFTSLEFARRCPQYAGILAFEPEPENYAVCRQAFSGLRQAEVFPFGLSDTAETLSMDVAGSGSAISNTGSTSIRVERLDDMLPAHIHPTLIKIDTEGAELQALNGARKTIRTHAPRLAVSVYHRAGDFWKIPEEILSISSSYKVYLRHYTESIYETVMFFIPTHEPVR